MTEKSKVWLVDGSRTPIGTFGKTMKSIPVEKLAGHVLKNAIRRTGIKPSQIDGIILGHRGQSSYAPNTSRFSALNAGLPASIPAMTVHRECGSGLQAVNDAADQIRLGRGDIYVAGGVESMSTVPYLAPGIMRFSKKFAQWFGLDKRYPQAGILSLAPAKTGPRLVIGFLDDGHVPLARYGDMKSTNMIATAECVSSTYRVSREEADAWSLRSHQRACAGVSSGRFDREIDPIQVGEKGYFSRDEHPRADSSAEKLGSLKAVGKSGLVTAGNSSGINDGACAVVLTSEKKGKELGLTPLAVLVDHCVVGLEPEQMGIGPVLAIKKLLKDNNLTVEDIDLFEINEAFAGQYLACQKLLGLDPEKCNVNGGAIALGHPIGMSGARLVFTLAHELKERKKKRGIAALCIGGGQGIATLVEAP
ncbi:MAG: thiolase family protein [Candidatus Obscuribacterales bacterium]|nr:thiolase family protein [Candidatus Obscuribacterales bacterium]